MGLTLNAARAKLRPRAKRRPQFGLGLAGLLANQFSLAPDVSMYSYSLLLTRPAICYKETGALTRT